MPLTPLLKRSCKKPAYKTSKLHSHARGATIGAMNDLAALARLLENLIRFGVITAVQMEPPRVQVTTGKLTTAWLPWLAGRAGSDREWDPPTVGEQVILLSPSGQLANGIVVTGVFSDHVPANGNRAGLHRRTYADGTVIEYDSIAHHLNATLVDGGTTNLISKGGINLVGDITHQGDYIQTGNQTVTGQVQVSIDVIAAGVSLVKHPHSGVKAGGDQSGVPIPS